MLLTHIRRLAADANSRELLLTITEFRFTICDLGKKLIDQGSFYMQINTIPKDNLPLDDSELSVAKTKATESNKN